MVMPRPEHVAALKAGLSRPMRVKIRRAVVPVEGQLLDISGKHGYPEGTYAIQVAGGNLRPFTADDVETVEEKA